MTSVDVQTTLRLVRGAQAGDRQALDDLFSRYLPKVRRIVALRIGCAMKDFAVYEDLVQESLLRAFAKLDQFKEIAEGTFYNWISSCVASAINLEFRKLGAQRRGGGKVKALGELGDAGLTASIFSSPEPGPRTRASTKELEEKVEEAILDLKSHHREVIILRHLCGMESEEIAGVLGFSSAATARKVLERAMTELKKKLGPGVLGAE
jgi:RNA polymerase sigma-70 factor (ECF subfamily)